MSRSAVMTSDTFLHQVASRDRLDHSFKPFTLGVAGLGFLLGGCAEPGVLTAPAREPRMRLTDRERVPLPIVAVSSGAATFDRASNGSAREGLSLLPAGRADAK